MTDENQPDNLSADLYLQRYNHVRSEGMLTQLGETLRKKQNRLNSESSRWQSRRMEWVERIDKLFETITEWLQPLIDARLVSCETTRMSITEHALGTYEAPRMRIRFFSGEHVELVPKGLQVVGGSGRVDLLLGLRTVMIVGQDDPPGWIFVERGARTMLQRSDFNRENFEQLLQEYVESDE
jgi:hypothetical protein